MSKKEVKKTDKEEEKKLEKTTESEESQVADPFAQMIHFYDNYAKSWSEAMSGAVASKGVAEAMGQQMEGSLEALTLWRKQMGTVFEQYLQQMSLPTKSQVVSLAERLTNVEMAIQDLDEKLDELLDRVKPSPRKKS
jgi:hypothetical protein